MKIEEIRDLKAKALLVLKGLFAGTLQPLTLQQIHPAQIATASALHLACCNELRLPARVDEPYADATEHKKHCLRLDDLLASNQLATAELQDLGICLDLLQLMLSKQLERRSQSN